MRVLRGYRNKLLTIIIMSFSLFLLACTSYFEVKPVGHQKDKEFWDDFEKSFLLLNQDKFRFFTFQNIDEFNKAPDSVRQLGIQKWQNNFPAEPFPPDNPPETIPAAKTPPKEKSGNHIRFLRDNIYTKTIWDFLK